MSRVLIFGWTQQVPDFVGAVQPVQGVQPKNQLNRSSHKRGESATSCTARRRPPIIRISQNGWTGWTDWTEPMTTGISRVQARVGRLDVPGLPMASRYSPNVMHHRLRRLWAAIRRHRALLLRAPIRRRRLIRRLRVRLLRAYVATRVKRTVRPHPRCHVRRLHWGRNPGRCPSLVPALGS